MRMIWNKGHRIRASDKHLVYHFSIETLLFVFVTVLLLLNSKQLMRTDWEHFSLLENGLTLSPYNFITILIATGVCALVAFLYYRFCYDSFKKPVDTMLAPLLYTYEEKGDSLQSGKRCIFTIL